MSTDSARHTIALEGCPETIAEFVLRSLDAVRIAVGVGLEFDSDTLPLLDHYLREVPDKSPATAALIAAMTGSYFGETVRRSLGGTWKLDGEDPALWRLVLPGGLSFSPVRMALAAILKDEDGDGNPDFQAPPKMMNALNDAMDRMGSVTDYEYYALSCRYDTLEHLQEVLLAVAAQLAEQEGGLN